MFVDKLVKLRFMIAKKSSQWEKPIPTEQGFDRRSAEVYYILRSRFNILPLFFAYFTPVQFQYRQFSLCIKSNRDTGCSDTTTCNSL